MVKKWAKRAMKGARSAYRKYRLSKYYTKQELEIIDSGIFDEKYYRENNPDLYFEKENVEPIYHFLKKGVSQLRDPSKDFDMAYFAEKNIKRKGVELLYSYVKSKDKGSFDVRAVRDDNLFTKRVGNRASKVVDIINYQFYDLDGKVLFRGGAERYVFDLAVMLKDMGYTPRILQASNGRFKKKLNGVDVIGCGVSSEDPLELSRYFNKYCRKSRLVIASPLDLASEMSDCAVVGINHGVYWDNVKGKMRSLFDDSAIQGSTLEALRNVNACVCVDTNFLNWVRTFSGVLAKRVSYVPNYFDEKVFGCKVKTFDKRLVFIYARRIVDYRGWDITRAVFARLLKEHKDVSLHIVGQPHDKEREEEVKGLVAMFPDQCVWMEKDMDEMGSVYCEGHVSLVPTLWSEGTSLSGIEAMASGNALVATNVGGLPNLVIDGYNGLLIDPTEEALYGACKQMILDRKETERMAKNAVAVSRCFTKTRWQEKWKRVLEDQL